MSSIKSPVTSTGSITDKAVQLINHIQSNLFERRNAVRYKAHHGHRFETILLKELTFCSQCNNLMVTLIAPSCKSCKLVCHKKCLESIDGECRVTGTKDRPPAIESQHKFESTYFFKPTYCDHCGILIKGIPLKIPIKGIFGPQGLECLQKNGGCGRTIHHDCKNYIIHKCISKQRSRIFPKNDKIDQDSINEPERWSKIRIEDFDLIKLIGTGTFSKVYLAKLRSTNEEFAIKVAKKTNLVVSSDIESAITERKVLQFGRQYPFLTIAHCCFHSRDRLFFVMEYVIGRDLVYHIRKARKFTEDRTRFYAAEIILALRFLHKQGVVYRDLKLDNVILDKHGHCKLLDFGMSKELSETVDMRTKTFCGTPNYISPETIKEQEYGFSVDWWALGVLMFEMLVGYSPFEAQDHDQLYRMIVTDEVKIPLFLSDEARCVLDGLLTKDPQNRLGCHILEGCDQAILEHPFFMFETNDGCRAHQWSNIQEMRMRPPYRPSIEDLELPDQPSDTNELTPISPNPLSEVSQADFTKFSFYSESFESKLDL